MRHRLKTALLVTALICGVSPAAHAEKAFWGTALGSGLGGLLGSQFGHGDGRLAYTGLGVFLGGLTGNGIGESLDNVDRVSYRHSYRAMPYDGDYYARPTYVYRETYVAPPAPPPRRIVYVQPREYVEEDYFVQTSVAPPPRPYCREYTQAVTVGNRVQESYGTACLQPDGSWRVQQ